MAVIITADTFDLLNQFADKILSQHGFVTKYKVSFDTLLHEKGYLINNVKLKSLLSHYDYVMLLSGTFPHQNGIFRRMWMVYSFNKVAQFLKSDDEDKYDMIWFSLATI